MNQYLFTYGMLTNRYIMDEDAQLIGAGQLKNWTFEMLTFANVRPESGEIAHGVLWQINDTILADCDVREGYPNLYTRIKVPVQVNKQIFDAWVYTLTGPGREAYLQGYASDYYVDSVLEGYLQHGVDTTQIQPAINALVFENHGKDYTRLI